MPEQRGVVVDTGGDRGREKSSHLKICGCGVGLAVSALGFCLRMGELLKPRIERRPAWKMGFRQSKKCGIAFASKFACHFIGSWGEMVSEKACHHFACVRDKLQLPFRLCQRRVGHFRGGRVELEVEVDTEQRKAAV